MSATTTVTATTAAEATPNTVQSPHKLAHYVLATTRENFQAMKTFYLNLLGGRVTNENEMICFISYDDEHHRVGIAAFPGTSTKVAKSAGLHHVAFEFKNLQEWALAYVQRKERFGIEPYMCTHHGVTISMYYKDPDGNGVETEVDRFSTKEEGAEFIGSKSFFETGLGISFDPAEFAERIFKAKGNPEEEEKLFDQPAAAPMTFVS